MKPKIILLYVIFATVFWKCLTLSFEFDLANRFVLNEYLLSEYKIVTAFLLFGVVPMAIVKFGLREKLSDYGLRLGNAVRTVRTFCIAAPVMVLIAYATGHNQSFVNIYPFNENLRLQNLTGEVSTAILVLHSVLYAGYYFGWEFMFRGFLQHGLTETTGIGNAILIQTFATTMLHFGHPPMEFFASILAGLLWGCLVWRTRSILSGMGQHAILGIVSDIILIRR
ncbi:MAG: CPBP family intramembrane metalloprotease [Planctomycetaceae bacterium]|jgi:membrane protease YdiL (CAAX protease family)|nr:CPBP family intramembrane metalloprotease [Planctomycetaceae bacterium]